jgi:hypothetical protein
MSIIGGFHAGECNRRDFLGRSGGAAAAMASGMVAPGQKQAAGRPNLVYLCADQLRYFSCV